MKLEFTRKEDFTAVHGRWPTKQYYKVGVKNDGTLTAIQMRGLQRHGAVSQEAPATSAAWKFTSAPMWSGRVSMVHTNMAVSANFRAPAYPQGVFGIESLMDDIAYALKMDPLEFRLKNMTREVSRPAGLHQHRSRRLPPPRRGAV